MNGEMFIIYIETCRLGCQIQMTPEMEGLEVELAPESPSHRHCEERSNLFIHKINKYTL